jgi:hypothetical protein
MIKSHVTGNNGVRYTPEVSLREYLLVAMPDEVVTQKILEERQNFHLHYDHHNAISDRPHIAIANFLAKEAMEETLIRWIQNVCRLHKGFGVTLNNYSGIPADTIYLRIQDPWPFVQLTNALKIIDGFIQSNDCPPVDMVTRPQLDIAESLPQQVYEKAIVEYAMKSFSGSFKVEKLVMLKREGRFERAEMVNTFTLSPLHE